MTSAQASAAQAPAAPDRLAVRGLQVDLAGRKWFAVRDISFAVQAGQVLGLVGESGSGKTTVALSLLGYVRRGLEHVRGEVLLDGADLFGLPEGQLRQLRGTRVSYVPQDPGSALNPARRIGPQITEVLEAHPAGGDMARVEEVLAEVGLPGGRELMHRFPHQLSGGQQQRLVLAMAFACRPSLVVLDEPTTSLDVTTQRQVLDTVRGLCSEYGVAAVYVTHDLAVVQDLADDIVVMYSGRIIEHGATRAVFSRPFHPYTRGLLSAIPHAQGRRALVGIDGAPPPPRSRPPGCSFEPRCPVRQEVCSRESPPPVEVEGRTVRCFFPQLSPSDAGAAADLAQDAPPAAPAVLEVSGLDSSYGRHQILRDVGLRVSAGSCTAVVGESGSGKTTLARCIVGMHAQWSGSVRLDGADLAHVARERPQQVRRDVQYIFQNPYASLNPRRTVGATLAEPLRYYFGYRGQDVTDRVASVTDSVSLPRQALGKHPDELSGGERQRVAIARALIVEPRVLVCDEITSSLDVSTQAIIIELLRQLRAERDLAMVFITHNLALVRSIAEDCVVLRGGVVVESGPVSQVLDRPSHEYTVRLMADAIQPASSGGTPSPVC